MEKDIQQVNGHAARATDGFLVRAGEEEDHSEGVDGPQLILPAGPRLVALREQNSVGAERFRVLASRLQYLQKQKGIKRVSITSAEQGDGKSVMSANLALTLARQQKVLLIDGDLRQSGLSKLFGTHHLLGLTDWWARDEDIRGLMMRVEGRSLWYLPAGQAAEQPLEILQSPRIVSMLQELSDYFDWLIIDSPPLVPVADGHIWTTYADGTLLVVRQGKTSRRLLKGGLENSDNLKLLGVVMNAVKERRYQYYYPSSHGLGRPNAPQPSSHKSANSPSAWSSSRK